MIFLFSKQKLYNTVFAFALVAALLSMVLAIDDKAFKTMATVINGKVIVIDAGHGTPDGGTKGTMGTMEKDLNLAISKKLGNLFTQSGAHVVYTREGDGTIADNLDDKIRNIKRNDMSKRKNIRDNSGADVFISIHMNFFEDPQYKGAQVFYKGDNEESRLLAECVQKYIKNFADSSNMREAKDSKNSIFILNDSKVPAILAECGFLSNTDEEKMLLDPSYQDKIAYAIFSGTLKYFVNK